MIPRVSLTHRPRLKRALIAATLVLLVVVLPTSVAALTAGQIPRGTTVLGVEIGGKSRAEAATQLRAALGEKLTEPITFSAGSRDVTLSPAESGVSLDIDATLKRASKRTTDPWSGFFSATPVEPVVSVDEKKLDVALTAQLGELITPITPPSITFEGEKGQVRPVATYGAEGTDIKLQNVTRSIQSGWLRQGSIPVQLHRIPPAHSEEDVDRILSELAEPAVAADVTVNTDGGEIAITPAHISASLVLNGDEKGAIHPHIDAVKLRDALAESVSTVGTPAIDATFTVTNGAVSVKPSEEGVGLDVEALTRPLLDALDDPAPRSVEGKIGPLTPALSTEDAEKLGVKEKISSFTTHFKGGQARNKNILIVADKVDGALVMPGDTFSLNGFTGERGYAQGYVDAPVIYNGKIKNMVGGGISQFATTLYNAVFFSGLEDTFHKAHGYYISRYPAGREATIFWPTLDLKFTNDSEHGVFINTYYDSTSITVEFWSTKRYEIESISGERHNHREIQTKYLSDEDGCIATQGIPGFDIVVWRVFKRNGVEVKREKIFTSYKAEPKFVCGDPPGE